MNKNICDVLKTEGIMSGGFGIAPQLVMRDSRLSIEAKAIYSYFQSFAGSSNTCFPSREVILRELNISKNRYYKYLNELIEYNYIRVEREKSKNGWKEHNTYVIVANPDSNLTEPINKKADTKVTSSQCETKLEKRQKSTSSQSETKLESEIISDKEIENLCEEYPDAAADIKVCYKAVKDIQATDKLIVKNNEYDKNAIERLLKDIKIDNIIDVVISTLDYNGKIKNKKAWIQTCLVNSIYKTDTETEKNVKKFKHIFKEKEKEEIEAEEKTVDSVPKVHNKIKDSKLANIKNELNAMYAKRAKAKLYGSTELSEIEDKIKQMESNLETYE